ncbi:MAG: 2-hydroxyacyl-CoA dehydratase family protein [Candidatus Adiutrix sp.]|jgi:benzoyl-CoA reductase/2-hydroxyglutaryl-CoA dehydratase subunit BcrC/BadD/HgdB|nr:2-hydroxyacyl-CoA dehydratase family protein [Candidatus Adiutrix sp.]
MSTAGLTDLRKVFERNPLRLDEAKAAGRKVVGHYCLYSPMELAAGAGAVAVSLCGTRQDAIPKAEEVLPRGLCPLIKSSYGFALLDSCHYLASSDLVVADTTCDGKKKMYELLARDKDLHLLQLPQNQDPETALPYWRDQLRRLRDKMRVKLNHPLTDDDLRAGIKLLNRERRALKALLDLSQNPRPPYSGLEILEICFKTGFLPDKEETITRLEALTEDGRQKLSAGESPVPEGAFRLLLTGVPVGMGSHKVVQLAEELGATVVVLDNCGGYKKVTLMMDEAADPLTEMATRYLNLPCAVMSPNPGRYERLRRLAADFRPDGVVDLVWQGCQPFATEAHTVRQFVQKELGRPYLMLETDYSDSDQAALKLRLEAFINQ